MISPQLALSLAAHLDTAEQRAAELERLTAQHSDLSAEDGYDIQRAWRALKGSRGATVVGAKAGLTSRAKQEAMGIREPIYGFIASDTLCSQSESLDLSALIHPRAEPEIAFVLGRDLRGPSVTLEMVLDATESVAPAIEVIDSRYQGFSFTLADVIADNASAARVLLGDQRTAANACDLGLVGMVFQLNGEIIDTAAGAAVLGHPANAVAWLANKLAEVEEWLPAGSIVMPGGMCGAHPLAPGDTIMASFDRLGTVTLACH